MHFIFNLREIPNAKRIIPTIQNVITTSQKDVVDIYNVNSG